jgi:hypothetical protein
MRRRLKAMAAGAAAAVLLATACEKNANVSGTWELQDAQGNDWTLKLVQIGSAVTGTVSAFGFSLPVTGSVEGNTLELGVSGVGRELAIEGTVSGDTMQGTISDVGTGLGTSFTGRRVSGG